MRIEALHRSSGRLWIVAFGAIIRYLLPVVKLLVLKRSHPPRASSRLSFLVFSTILVSPLGSLVPGHRDLAFHPLGLLDFLHRRAMCTLSIVMRLIR